MSEYIYGSSLRAAKSKANYLFEGDFRRRPNQNLSGASHSVARVELLQQAAEQRQNREDIRRKENATLKIQSFWRGYRCRKSGATLMRTAFDRHFHVTPGHKDNYNKHLFDETVFENVSREFIMFHDMTRDEQRIIIFIDLMMKNQDVILKSKARNIQVWLHRLYKLLCIVTIGIEKHKDPSRTLTYLNFLECYTRPDKVLIGNEITTVWQALVDREFHLVMRNLIERTETQNADNQSDPHSRLIVELMYRSLNIESTRVDSTKLSSGCSFFVHFLRGPIGNTIDKYYLPKLLQLNPTQLGHKCLLDSFANSYQSILEGVRHCKENVASARPVINTDYSPTPRMQDCEDTIWLCHAFLRALHTRVLHFSNTEKITYLNIVSLMLAPADHVTSICLIQASSEDTEDLSEAQSDDIDRTLNTNRPNIRDSPINRVITKTIEIINQADHIDSLKSILFHSECMSRIQEAVVRICNLMLAHEYLAIFNCRLLYTVAFNQEFARSLWKSILTASAPFSYGMGTPIYSQIRCGSNINQESWKLILPNLRLFCSLCSYVLPTLDDEEFYTNNDEVKMFDQVSPDYSAPSRNLVTSQLKHKTMNDKKSIATSGLYLDKEWITISAVLRDICVGIIEILHQSNKNSSITSRQHSDATRNTGADAFGAELLSFQIKSCFQALVRLICQLHARDSRKQFCPEGHWICPTVVIPATKSIDFQLLSVQHGRLLDQLTNNSAGTDTSRFNRSSSNASSEIKTVLILQEIPFVISFHDRVQIFHELLSKERQVHQSDGYHFGLPGTAIHVHVRRNYIYEDAFEKLSYENEPDMKLPLKVSLMNAVGAEEAGIDGGGLTKEFLDELLRAGFDPMRGFFKYTTDHLLYPNPSARVLFSTSHEGFEVHYEFLGRILGKAIFEKIMVELPLASFFLAKLLAVKNSSDVDLHNLESLDPILYKNLVYLKNYKGDVANLNLDFTISNNELDEHEVVELKPNGSKIAVTRENKIEYVHLIADYRLNKQIKLQCAAFKRGLAQLIDLDWLRMFDPRELQILISGAPTTIDVEDWRTHTIYGNGYDDKHEAINAFWSVVSQFNETQKRKLLKFATSCSLPPLLGFRDLVPRFAIAPSEESRLPTASTCMNLLKLPQCESETTMRQKLLYAIESNSGFELS